MKDYEQLFKDMLGENPELLVYGLKIKLTPRNRMCKYGVLSITDSTGQVGSDYILTSSDIDRSDDSTLGMIFYPMIDSIINRLTKVMQ